MHGFRYYFTPLTGVLFTFRSRYCFTIGHQGVLSLAGWAPPIHARFHGTGTTREFLWSRLHFAYEAFTLFGGAFQLLRLCSRFVTPLRIRSSARVSHDPHDATPTGLTRRGFRLFPFRSPLLGESMFLFFPAVTEMGQFSAFPTSRYAFTRRSWRATPSRFRISDIPGSTPACGSPRLFAAKPRPSSALGAKASTRAPYVA